MINNVYGEGKATWKFIFRLVPSYIKEEDCGFYIKGNTLSEALEVFRKEPEIDFDLNDISSIILQ